VEHPTRWHASTGSGMGLGRIVPVSCIVFVADLPVIIAGIYHVTAILTQSTIYWTI